MNQAWNMCLAVVLRIVAAVAAAVVGYRDAAVLAVDMVVIVAVVVLTDCVAVFGGIMVNYIDVSVTTIA